MALTQRASEGLDGLLDAIDSLRSQGISDYISLPRIIICGDQSSGKSSVLEAISGVSFPVESSLCPRFPIELILRKTTHVSAKVSIVAHESRSEEDRAYFSTFHGQLETFQDLPNLIWEVKKAMERRSLKNAFLNDLLRVEISGPDRPHLTIVDLPGLIHSQTNHQSASDIDLIKDIVKCYMKEPRNIILAVVSAKNNYANQIVLELAREADPGGIRTLGVITKPDTLIPESSSQKMYVSLAMNLDVFLLGWHVLINRDTEVDTWTMSQRTLHEDEFFSGDAWASLSKSNVGIKSLRDRLNKLFLHRIAFELPNLMKEITVKSKSCQLQLDKLPRPRTNPYEQRLYLVQMSQSFQALVQAAITGTYHDPFFGDDTNVTGYQKRMRAVVQNLSHEFANRLSQYGRRRKIVSDDENTDDKEGTMELITRAKFVEKLCG